MTDNNDVCVEGNLLKQIDRRSLIEEVTFKPSFE